MKRLKMIKSLHICLRLPIIVFDENLEIIEEYRSNQTTVLFNDYENILKEALNSHELFSFISGELNDMFLLYNFENFHILFGPFKCNIVDKTFFYKEMKDLKISTKDQEILYSYLNDLPLFSTSELRDILIMVHYFFSGEIKDLMSDKIHLETKKYSTEITDERIEYLVSQNFDLNMYLYLYEHKILDYVRSGDVNKLRDMVFKLSNGVIPAVTGDTLRSEKNYSIVVFEKLSQAGIELGMDIITAYGSRDLFIKKTELSNTLDEILQVRDSAIVYYTSEVNKVITLHLSPLTTSIIQYINTNMYRPLKVKELASYFNISESKLRTLFKTELGSTVQDYIIDRKIEEAKLMLKSNVTTNEAAYTLGFADSSHFSRVFKKIVGKTPKHYQQSATLVD